MSMTTPTTIALATVPMPTRWRSGHQPSSTTKLISTDHVPMPSPNVRESPWCRTSQGASPRSPRTIIAIVEPNSTRPTVSCRPRSARRSRGIGRSTGSIGTANMRSDPPGLESHVTPETLRAADGETITRREGRDVVILVESEELTITWSRYAPGEVGTDPHVHREHTDAFYVLDGELTFGLGPDGEPVSVAAGGFVAVPPNVVHSFRN